MGHEITAGNAGSALPSSPLAEAKEQQQGGASQGSWGGHHAARASAGRQGNGWCCVGPALHGQGRLTWLGASVSHFCQVHRASCSLLGKVSGENPSLF